jgi:nitrite reductase/ring-hydroxylating ferredoxin subunit
MESYVSVAKVEHFREGKIRRYFVDGTEIGVVSWGGRFYAFGNRCPHRDFELHFGYVEGDCVHCPIHYANFDLASGRAMGGPPDIGDLPVYRTRVEGDDVQVSLTG